MIARAEPHKNKCAAPTKENDAFANNAMNDSANRGNEKAYATLQARFAIIGHTLYRTVNADGTILYLAGKWGYFRELESLDAAKKFLSQIGGSK